MDFNLNKYLYNNPLLSEIKVNNPSKTFRLTDKAKAELNEWKLLNKLVDKFTNDEGDKIYDELHDFDLYMEVLNITIFEDEKILKIDEPNNLNEFIDGLVNKLGWYEDDKDAKGLIDNWVKRGWITNVAI